ncbi:hypothetical protein SCP_0209110 [Sparassis crispa]|uniref:Uncharacterized protein n=1 Tax=Sparassis crispa TaxID=139825 RepID=A0A401GC28_9APHY|nr:hypothetical protein SCP_0209110 [Sparassis crispa]GBE79710.1 hypothetical protein SCP_0209110 [Sparassis crispa]
MEKSQIEDTTSTAKPDELLQRFLRALVSNRVPMTKAIGVAAKILKEHKTPSAIGRLTDIQLIAAGINEEGLRRLILAAIRKGGFNPHSKSTKNDAQGTSNSEGPLASTSRSAQTDISPRKRKRTSDTNEFLPDRPEGEEVLDSLEFDEILDEEVLKNKNIFINRAPIMAVWAMVVLERQGFKREEALSIALAFTQMNAIYGGVSANIFPKGKEKEFERSLTSSQPYVDLMGRKMCVYLAVRFAKS